MAAGDIAHLMGGVMLVLTLLMLAQRRTISTVSAYGLQSIALGLAVAAHGLDQGRFALLGIAALVLVVQAAAIPAGLRHVARETSSSGGGSPVAMAVGVGVVVLAILAVRGAVLPAAMAREDLAAALSVALLGVLIVVTRRDPLGQMIGFLSVVSGCLLAAVSLPGLPVVAILMGMALLAVPVMGVLIVRHTAGHPS